MLLTLTVTNGKFLTSFFIYIVFSYFANFFIDKRPKRQEANINISTYINTLGELLRIIMVIMMVVIIISVMIITLVIYHSKKTKIILIMKIKVIITNKNEKCL